jgi:hypothetical protein
MFAPLAAAQTAPAENNGQDPTQPVTRLDVRLKFKQGGDGDAEILTLRADRPVTLGGGWQLSTRIDLPIVRNGVPSGDNPNGDYETGFSDILMQALFIAPPQGAVVYAFGGQLILPTASQDQQGSGKVQLAPTVAAIRQMPSWGRGSFWGMLGRWTFSVGGDGAREDISEISLQPIVNLNLPDQWFVTFSPEMLVDMHGDGDIFLPFDMTIGRKIGPAAVLSVTADAALANDYEQYDWQVEGRAGFFF